MGPVFLLNVGVVIFLVGATTRELNVILLTKTNKMGVYELAPIVTVDAL